MTASGAGLFQLFRPRLRGLLVVALLVSLSTASSLVEPWIYRAIIDDIAGVFVAPDPLEYADRALEDVTRSLRHLPGSLGRMFNAPLQKFSGAADERRALESRTPQQAIATVLVGALLLVLVRLVSEWCALRGDIRATAEANSVERGFILRTFRHVTALPLSYFSLRSSQAVARRVDQADEISPIVMAVSKEIWPDAFSLVVILGILVSVNWELALVSLLSRLPEGLNTEIGEGGVALSAGERQRVLLGRAFVAKPRVLVLDEATANLDYRTEALNVIAAQTGLLDAQRAAVTFQGLQLAASVQLIKALGGGWNVFQEA